jgi:membrane protein implicated in regulation of membrane protease activity
VLLVGAILLAVFVLPEPWNYIAVIAGAVLECFETGFFIWWTRRRHPTVGAEAFVGRAAEVVEPLRPRGRVRIDGELWNARCEDGEAGVGDSVRVIRVDGLTLLVEPG